MKRICDLIFAPSLITILACTTTQADEPIRPALSPDAVWVMKYDDKLDGEVKAKPGGEVRWRVAVRNGKVAGSLADAKANDPKDHRLAGEVSPGKPSIVSFRQDGPGGLVCVYAGRVVAADRIVGTWFDNRGGSGDFEVEAEKR